MRHQGQLRKWNDERGFGFVEPHEGGEPVFVHIKNIEDRQRRPAVGDLISFEVARDENGRLSAARIRFLENTGRPARKTAKSPSGWPYWPGGLFLVAITTGAAIGRLPWWSALLYLAMSLITWFAYRIDKRAAQGGLRRIPERTLHLLELAGGWPGALMAQFSLRHKNRKGSYQFVFWIVVAMNLGVLIWILKSDSPQQDLIDLLKALDRLW